MSGADIQKRMTQKASDSMKIRGKQGDSITVHETQKRLGCGHRTYDIDHFKGFTERSDG